MKKILLAVLLTWLGFEVPAFASEFQEQAMCTALNSDAAFPRISIQTEASKRGRGILVLLASDGWTQMYSGVLKTTPTSLEFSEDGHLVTARFLKVDFKASISFNGDMYACDERSFGH